MIYSWVTFDEVITIIENTYHVKSSDYIYRLPQWINEALSELKVRLPYEPAVSSIKVTNSKFQLPKSIKNIALVVYKGCIVDRLNSNIHVGNQSIKDYSGQLSVMAYDQIKTVDANGDIKVRIKEFELAINNGSSKHSYSTLNNKFCETTVPDNERVDLYYTRLPHSFDPISNQEIPMIPDGELTKQSIVWYVLRSLLYGGYVHPTLSLASGTEELNPARMFERYADRARGELLDFDNATRERLKDINTTFIHDISRYSRFKG